jgi:type II secretory pathway component PulF
VTAWLLSVAAAGAVHQLLVRRPWPRRVPTGSVATSPRRSARSRTPSSRRSDRSRRSHSSRPSGTWDLVACCDLLAVAATAGCSLHQAVVAVGHSGTGPVARALAGAGQDVDRGTPLVQAVESLTDRAGVDARPLVSALVVAAGSGTPVAPALQRLADAERRRGRRAVEARVRRLPVLLLVPLVTCILPAFVVLTLVPVGVAASRNGLAGTAQAPASPTSTDPGVRRAG